MKIEHCPKCNSKNFEECEVRDPTVQDYYCNSCGAYFNIYDFMP